MPLVLSARSAGDTESRHSPRFATRSTRRIGEGTKNALRRLAQRDEAAVSLAGIGGIALGVAAVILGAVVSLQILSALTPTYAGSVGNISENLTTADWGDDTANSISPVFAMLVSLGGLFAIIGLVFVAFALRKRGA